MVWTLQACSCISREKDGSDIHARASEQGCDTILETPGSAYCSLVIEKSEALACLNYQLEGDRPGLRVVAPKIGAVSSIGSVSNTMRGMRRFAHATSPRKTTSQAYHHW